MDGDSIDSRRGNALAADPEYLELLSERRRLVRRRRAFVVAGLMTVATSVALVGFGQFWIGVFVGAIATAVWLAWLEFVQDPRRRLAARIEARNEAIVAKREAASRRQVD